MKYLAVFALLLTAACSPPTIKTQNGYEFGKYHIARYTIEPKEDMATEKNFLHGGIPEFTEFKALLDERLPAKLADYGTGNPDVGMTITVNLVTMKTNSARAILISDAMQVYTRVTLWDLNTHQEIGKIGVATMSKITGGLFGVIADSFDNAEDIQKQKNKLADQYIETLLKELYPKK